MASSFTRDWAWGLVTEWTVSPALRQHMRAVELSMRHFALSSDADPEGWGIVGLLHDFDYERYPNADRRANEEHPSTGVAHLRSIGFPEEWCDAILGHARFTGVPRTTAIAKTLFAVDELSGFVVACGLVRPSRSLGDLEVRSVEKKLKDKGFARGVSREDVRDGAAELGRPLADVINDVLEALRPAERELGLGVG